MKQNGTFCRWPDRLVGYRFGRCGGLIDKGMKKQIAVTGASGFVGRHVCAELSAKGWAVRGLVRRAEAAEVLPEGVEPFLVSDVADPTCWAQAIFGSIAVVHLIGRAHILRDTASNPLTAYREVNVEITKSLVEACLETGISHFIYMSSIASVGKGTSTVYTEKTPCRPENAYGISKWEAEKVVLGASKKGNFLATVLRPPLVYGSGVKGTFLRLLRLVERRIPFPLGLVHDAHSMVYVRNLSSATAAFLEQPERSTGIFHIADKGEPLSTRELVSRLGMLMGRPAYIVPIPVTLMRLGGPIVGRKDDVDRLTRPLIVSTERIRKELGWEPPHSVDEGLVETVGWYCQARQSGDVK